MGREKNEPLLGSVALEVPEERQQDEGWEKLFWVFVLITWMQYFFGIAFPLLGQTYYANKLMCPQVPSTTNSTSYVISGCDVSEACPDGADLLGTYQWVDKLGGFVVGKLWGALADAYGRRPFLILNSAAYCVAMLMIWLSRSPQVFVLSGFVSGFFAGGTLLFNSYVIDIVPKEQKGSRLGILAGLGIGTAFGVGIPVGAAVDSAIGETIFLVCAIGLAVSTAITAAFIPESLTRPTREVDWAFANPFGVLKSFWTQPQLRVALIIIVAQSYGLATFQSQVVNYARWRWDFGEATSGAVVGMIGIGVAAIAPLMFWLCGTTLRTLEVTTALLAVGLVLASVASNDVLILIVLACIVLAFAQPCLPALSAFLSNLAAEHDQAVMQANYSVINNLINVPGIYASTALFVASAKCQIYAGSMMLVAAIVVAVGLVTFSAAWRMLGKGDGETEGPEASDYYLNEDRLT